MDKVIKNEGQRYVVALDQNLLRVR